MSFLSLFGIKRKKYGCSCEGKSYDFVKKTSDNSYYKCSICEAEDHLLVYRGGVVSINDRMLNWHSKRVVDNTFNKSVRDGSLGKFILERLGEDDESK